MYIIAGLLEGSIIFYYHINIMRTYMVDFKLSTYSEIYMAEISDCTREG